MASTTEIVALLSATDAEGRVDPMAYEAQRLILQHQGLGSVDYRDVAVGMVRIYAAVVAADPHKPIDQVRSAATHAWQHWEQGLAQAQRDGREREYIGSAAGVEIRATLVPASKVSKLGKAAQIMEDIAPRAAAEAREGLADARAHDGAEHAPERHAGLPGRARAYAEGLEEVGQAARRVGEAGEVPQQMLRGLVGQARQDGQLDDLVRAARATDNVECLLRSGQLEPHDLTAILKRTPGVFDGRIDFPTALDQSMQGVDLTWLTTRQLGDIGEAIQTHDLVKQGYNDIVAIKNRSGHGIDLVGRSPDGDLEFFEIQTSAKRLERAIDAQGHWDPKNTIPGLKSIAQDISREIGPEAEHINATWVWLNLSRSPDAPHLQIERKLDPWVKPAAPKQTMLTPGDADHPDHAAFDTILRTVQGDGRWNVAEGHNIAASLLKEYKADPLCKTLDSVRIGGSTDTPRIFAVSSPHGDRGPDFHVHVQAEQAAQRPAAESFAQVQQINQQQALTQETEQQNLAHRGPRMS
ncbi:MULTISPECIES: XVIPCD domain-containing protein [Pseudomonas syringae group]|uniref:XVIPCD domain-containing protein n=1 Tax=Pseudomonas syringae group TaxID=136849 RepID=UPI001C3195C3|nr:XVIPCD domain-containing protein [Pseudomonas viridiflava]QXG50044.1 hypothetical protein KTT57_13895 [Pseudomonas viridiflava]